jgi:hypothetical protein
MWQDEGEANDEINERRKETDRDREMKDFRCKRSKGARANQRARAKERDLKPTREAAHVLKYLKSKFPRPYLRRYT